MQSEGSLIAVSLQTISETVSEIGETMGHIEVRLEDTAWQKVEELEAKLERREVEISTMISRLPTWHESQCHTVASR